jgi:hypothetical protein
MRYYEIIQEATEQYWDHIFRRYLELEQEVATDPQGVIVECEETERFLQSMTPADPEEELLIESAIDSYNILIEKAERIIDQQQP